jgi:hypothetical protein|tara:strand:+ start:5113 stop:5547 length:435 start_codon:yes stop_codon:yes gene_type:complete
MISRYVLEFDLSEKINDDLPIDYQVFKNFTELVGSSFKINIEGVQKHNECTTINEFVQSSDWFFELEDRTINGVYAHDTNELDIIYVFKNQSVGVHLKPKYLYVFPYWLCYKFTSDDKTTEQKIVRTFLNSTNRPYIKRDDFYW